MVSAKITYANESETERWSIAHLFLQKNDEKTQNMLTFNEKDTDNKNVGISSQARDCNRSQNSATATGTWLSNTQGGILHDYPTQYVGNQHSPSTRR